MKPPDHATTYIMASAEADAISEARRLSREALVRAAQTAAERLRDTAVQLARSPAARDQVVSLALSAAAGDLEDGRAPAVPEQILPEPGPNSDARRAVRARVLGSGFLPTVDARCTADDLERRHRPASSNDADLSARLVAEANLHQRLWDDPRLPAADHVRLTMLFSIPHLLDRADLLAPGRRPQARTRTVDAREAARAAPGQWRDRREVAARHGFGRRLAVVEG